MERSGFHGRLSPDEGGVCGSEKGSYRPRAGSTPLRSDLWLTLAASPDFWALVDRKILTVSQRAQQQIVLTGGAFVGRALIEDVVVEVIEKVAAPWSR